jgi:hypothetical protein
MYDEQMLDGDMDGVHKGVCKTCPVQESTLNPGKSDATEDGLSFMCADGRVNQNDCLHVVSEEGTAADVVRFLRVIPKNGKSGKRKIGKAEYDIEVILFARVNVVAPTGEFRDEVRRSHQLM